MRPFVAIASPGVYLAHRFNQYKKQKQETSRTKAAEKEIANLNNKIDKLMVKLDEQDLEPAISQEEECVICINAKATMQTFPCAHQVVCRRCFVRTIQVAVSQRVLPLRCVVCRAKVLRLRQSSNAYFPTTSLGGRSNLSIGRKIPSSITLYSFNSEASWDSGILEPGMTNSEASECHTKPPRVYHGHNPPLIERVKVSSVSGARNKDLTSRQLPPAIKIENYDIVPFVVPFQPKAPRCLLRENKVVPQGLNIRLPTIKEYSEFGTEKPTNRGQFSSFSRLRCARKLVSQMGNKGDTLKGYNVYQSPTYCKRSPKTDKQFSEHILDVSPREQPCHYTFRNTTEKNLKESKLLNGKCKTRKETTKNPSTDLKRSTSQESYLVQKASLAKGRPKESGRAYQNQSLQQNHFKGTSKYVPYTNYPCIIPGDLMTTVTTQFCTVKSIAKHAPQGDGKRIERFNSIALSSLNSYNSESTMKRKGQFKEYSKKEHLKREEEKTISKRKFNGKKYQQLQ